LEKKVPLGEVQVGVEPEGMGISPDGKILVNTSETTNMAHFIDPVKRQVVASVLVDQRPRFAAFTPDGSELWVSSEVGGTVAVIDPVNHLVKHKVEFAIPGMRADPIQPVGINITQDGSLAFVALGPANHVAVVDTKTYKVIKYLLVGQRVWHMAFTPDEKYLLTTNGLSNDVSVIDVAALKVVNTIQVGELPWGVAISDH
jgi:PQQ-dependent catabolism-associated beta-propeller protein